MNTPTDNPDWLNEILETLSLTEGVDTIDHKPARPDSDTYDITVDYGEERFEFQVESNGTEHGVNYDGSIFDITAPSAAHWYFAAELYTRLQQAKRQILELQGNDQTVPTEGGEK
jgi:hypothetical protein